MYIGLGVIFLFELFQVRLLVSWKVKDLGNIGFPMPIHTKYRT